MKRVGLGDHDLALWDEGAGAPLLLVHGFPLDHRMWSAQVPAFAGRYRVLAPDLRGFGASGATEGDVLMEDFADDLAALLAALDIREPVVFCGLSMGGYIAWQFARRHRNRLRALVLCDTRSAADTPAGAENRRKTADEVLRGGTAPLAETMLPNLLAERTLAQRADLVEAVRGTMLAAPPAGVAAAQRGMARRPDASDWLSQIDVPTLVVVGEHDVISPPDEMRRMAAAIPGSRFVVVPEAGHLAPLENPAAFNAALVEFLESLNQLA